MRGLANIVKRVSPAPHRLRRPSGCEGTDFREASANETILSGAADVCLGLLAVARQSAPTVIVMALNIFR